MFLKSAQQYMIKHFQTLKSQPIKKQSQILSILFCITLFIYSTIYCQFYVTYIAQEPIVFTGSILWTLRKYGVWLIATPYLLIAYSRLWPKHKTYLVGLYVGSFFIAMSYTFSLDLFLQIETTLAYKLVIFTPVHIVSSTLILLGWLVLMRPKANVVQVDDGIKEIPKIEQQVITANKTLQVYTGTQEIDIKISDIESISAAGNYMEVYDGQKNYIVRTTMIDLEDKLRSHQFIRIHRSYLVNYMAITVFNNQQSVTLRSGNVLPVTRKYYRNITNNQ